MKSLKFLENVYAGHRAFVLGTGKSLDGMPLNFLGNEFTFGINRIGMTYLPTFYWLATTQVNDAAYRVDADAAIESSVYSFVASFLKGTIPEPEEENVFWMNIDHVDGLNPTIPGDICAKDWVEQDIARGNLSGYGHSGFAVIRLAIFMGFNPIYLLGMDGKYKYHEQGTPDPNHFGENYETGKYGRPQAIVDDMNMRIVDSHTIAKLGADILGKAIINASENSHLKQYPKVKFEELFE